MTIQSLQQVDLITDVDFKKGSHVFFDIPFEGGRAAMEYQSENEAGYGFLAWLDSEHPSLDVTLIPPHKEWDVTIGQSLVGDEWTFFDEDAQVTWHGVYTHSVEWGYYPHWYVQGKDAEGIERMIGRLDEWWEENEEEIPLNAVHTILWGHGGSHAKVGQFRAQTKLFLRVLIDTEVEFQAYWTD